jgi:predicted aconitase with swiveling domain
MTKFNIKKVVRGNVTAELLVIQGSFSFMGDVDLETACIIAKSSPNYGKSIAGKILVFDETKGSSGGATVLITLANQGKAPAAIISSKPADFNLTEGAILAKIPYACNIDIISLHELKSGSKAEIDLEKGELVVIEK